MRKRAIAPIPHRRVENRRKHSLSARRWAVLLWLGFLSGIGLSGCADGVGDPEAAELRLVLDYLPNPLHAGIYYAESEDRYADRGIDLSITAPTSTADTLRLVAAGRADVGLVPLMDFLRAVDNGQDLQLVMALVDRPLAAVLVREATGITRPRELEGHLVGLTGVPSDRLTLNAMVRNDGGDPSKVETVIVGFNGAQNLVAETVDAIFGFWSYEGVLVRPSVDLRELHPEDYGIPNYPEIVAFARRDFAREHRDALRAFREATVAGYVAGRNASPSMALAPLSEVLEGESPADLEPFWKVLLPVLPGSKDFRGLVVPEEIRAYRDWAAEEGFLSGSGPVEKLIFELAATG